MSYLQAAHFAQTWGVVLLAVGFAIATIYALWPANKEKFERAAQAPLIDGDDDDGQ
ncbi:MAG: cbb3-type cytochrome c oxidase subunit 3 [Hyphomonadaceae bacterium]|nr:cbb3-type cytochrome c oxidase subunit 3 [Hyphomonadaceae bacterium]